MPRIIETAPFAPAPDVSSFEITVVTPHYSAAGALGVPPLTLRRLGEDVVRNAGLNIASAYEAKYLLKNVVARKVPGTPAGKYARRVAETVNTILRTGIDMAKLREHCEPRLLPVVQVAESYRARLRDRGLIDPQEVMLEAARIGPEKRALIIYGYFRGRREEIDFIDSIAGEGSVYYLPCGEHDIFSINRNWLAELKSRGWKEADGSAVEPFSVGAAAGKRFLGGAGLIGGAANSYSFTDLDSEVRFAIGHAKRCVAAGVRPESIAILVEDADDYAHKMAEVADEYGLPLDFTHKVPLAETRLGSYLQILTEVVESECEFEYASHLLQHALSGTDSPEDLWRQARSKRLKGFEQWGEFVPHIDCLKWPESQTTEEWGRILSGAFETLGVRDAVKTSARDQLALEQFETALLENAKHEPGELGREHFLAAVREILTDETVRFDPSSGGVPVLTAKTAVGGSFKHVIVPGMAEGMIPPTPTDSPVVDFFERGRLAEHGIIFESAADVARWNSAEFYFALLTADESLTLTYPETLSNKETVASPFFTMLGLEPSHDPPVYISSPQEELCHGLRTANRDDGPFIDARRRFELEMLRESQPGAGDHDGVLGRRVDPYEMWWSVSQLTQYGQCEFRWFSSRLLNLAVPDEKSDDMDVRARGSFFHKVMEIVGRRALNAEDQRAAMLEALEEAFSEAEKDEELNVTELPDWHLRRGSYLNQLRRVINSPDLFEAGSRIIAVEEWYKTEWRGLKLRGKIDRIDEAPEGLRAIDYKLGSTRPKGIKNHEGDLKTEVQLSLYTQAALAKLYPGRQALEGAYFSLGKAKLISRVREPDTALEEFAEHLKHSFETGRFPVAPDHKRDACTYCDFVALCRKGARLDRVTEDDGTES
ncbi:MAG TPA: PD-(D/E)XK nuclease family protein [Pyrinomonadaceae bacterium]|nr:PD-(D/E)XK nuclease family protein [Pyrinomonadaceae bacterium]